MMRLPPRHLPVLLVFLLVACGSSPATHTVSAYGMSKTRPDPLMERRIIFLHPPSGERLDIVYVRGGRYDKTALKKINYLFRDRHTGTAGTIDPELIDYLIDIRTRLGLPPTVTFEILSGYRTRTTNKRLARNNSNVATESLHVHGWAVDFRIADVDGGAICEIAKTMQRGGVAYYPGDNHIHVDLGNIRTWKQK
ncbi:MAG: DUF882 domain-containing protein [Alphaproteobacteria bacterium]|nr:DUF882 domain-containing protein [Alphaproteobacteria bacterium]